MVVRKIRKMTFNENISCQKKYCKNFNDQRDSMKKLWISKKNQI